MKLLLLIISFAMFSCNRNSKNLSIHIVNNTMATKHLKLTISPLINIDQDIKVSSSIPSWPKYGDFKIARGTHVYAIECDGIENKIVDSFKLLNDSYFTITLRSDLTGNRRKDSLTVTLIDKSKEIVFQ